ncbi:MAG: prolipoprotein diacylglyceryl transferase, partial [Anaerotignum sp.]|nr:prolipoprotein diacylglyceryl transferase [Anaerotignum sp.]
LGRVWIEGLRTDQLTLGGFAVSQVLSAVLIVAAAVFLIWKGKQTKPVTEIAGAEESLEEPKKKDE